MPQTKLFPGVDHGPSEWGMTKLPDSRATPWLRCLCGWESAIANLWWEDVGKEFDEHLAGVKEIAPSDR